MDSFPREGHICGSTLAELTVISTCFISVLAILCDIHMLYLSACYSLWLMITLRVRTSNSALVLLVIMKRLELNAI